MNCKVRNANLYYEVSGEGKPVVMLHGCSPDHRLMTGCMEPIFSKREGYERIYPDLPGMGKSDSPDWIDSTDRMLDAILEFINQVVPSGSFLLAGESYGGYLARGVTAKMPDRVSGMLLICPVVVPAFEKRSLPPHTAVLRDTEFLAGLTSREAEEFCNMAVIQNESAFHRYKAEIDIGLKAANQTFIARFKKKYAFSFGVDDPQEAKFRRPVLLLAGRQDSCVGYRDLWSLLENYPRATFAVLDGAGHNLQIEQAELFHCLVDDWITRIEKEQGSV